MKTVTNLNSDIYYQGNYWNNIPQIQKYISKNLTGNGNLYWIEDFKRRYAKKPFKKALFINCGNGRWEREFIDRAIVKKATAFDVSPTLIKEARKNKGKRDIDYKVFDVNKIKFKENSFDLVVNIAALHHTQYINRTCLMLAKSLKPDGLFISHDYIGPGRNQYSAFNWIILKIINNFLPENVNKSTLGYPHLPTMLDTDPTEAIHSNLIVSTIRRYFDILEKKDSNGAIAYELFTHNPNFQKKVKSTPRLRKILNKILLLDKLLTQIKAVPVFFSLIIAKPNRSAVINTKKIQYYQKQEDIREKYSFKMSNTYTFFNYLKILRSIKSNKRRLHMISNYCKYIRKRSIEHLSNLIKYIR